MGGVTWAATHMLWGHPSTSGRSGRGAALEAAHNAATSTSPRLFPRRRQPKVSQPEGRQEAPALSLSFPTPVTNTAQAQLLQRDALHPFSLCSSEKRQ